MKAAVGITGVSPALGLGMMMLLMPLDATAQTSGAPALPAVSTVSVTNYQLISERRVARTVSDFTYRITVRNGGSDLVLVSGTVVSTTAATTIPDADANFGDVASSAPANSTDTITLRQDRTVPFNTSQLRWTFRAAPGEGVAPDPGAANDLTVAGIDLDNDGVRDDLERYVSITYPSSQRTRASLLQLGKRFQEALSVRASPSAAQQAARSISRALRCVEFVAPDEFERAALLLEHRFTNTIARLRALEEFEVHLSAATFSSPFAAPDVAACEFNPAILPN